MRATAAGPAGGALRVSPRAASLLCVGVMVLLAAAELVAPQDMTFGAAYLVPVVGAWAFAERWAARTVVAMAVVSRGADALSGDIHWILALLEMSSYAVVALMIESRPGGVAAVAPPEPPASVPAPAPRDPLPPAPLLADLVGLEQLTARERQVIELAARGLTAAQIADRLVIGRRTVETHLSRAYSKLGIRSKRDLVAHYADRAS